MNESTEAAAVGRRTRVRVWTHRTAAVAGAGVVVVVALWAAGVRIPTDWSRKPPHPAAAHVVPPATVTPVIAEEPQDIILPGTDSSVSRVPLPLILAATFPGRNIREGRAAIGVNFANPQTFAAGALLSNGARLVEIHDDRVILERAGRHVTLRLSGSKDAASVALQKRASGDLDIAMVGGAEVVRAEHLPRENQLTDFLVPTPRYDASGGITGFEVYPGRNRAEFYRLGLQQGDVIEVIDGIPLNDLMVATEAFQLLRDGYVVTAAIRRKNDRIELPLDGSAFMATKNQDQVPPAAIPISSPTS